MKSAAFPILFVTLLCASACTTTSPRISTPAQNPVEPAVNEGAKPAPDPAPTKKFVKGKERLRGLFDVILDRKSAKLWLELPKPDENGLVAEVLYVESLAHGLGSNPVGLDRGQIGSTRVVRMRRIGHRLFLEQPNLDYRALSDNADERRAVEQAFARSVIWSGKVVAEDPDGTFLVDFTDFAVRDAHDVVRTLDRSGQGTYKLDADRSALETGAVLAFPDNLEFEALLTFEGSKPGAQVRSVTPTPEAITLVQHHSLVRLPDDDYQPREFDPRSGALWISFSDYAAPLDASIERRWVVRHRLEKKNPRSMRTQPVEPIVYYVDRGAPEPVRSALIEGASWWNQAFEAAGYENAFRVELLPEDAHPLDVRYNVIQWVHRSTRGWSYGGGVVDPRTGERIKGHVSLGSLRVRQDRRIFEGLLGAGETGSGSATDPVQLALARIRQLAAHEVGHTIGLAHNFAASTYGRASVMDYPAPLVRPASEDSLDVSEAYAVGIGDWDALNIRYLYDDFAAGVDESAQLGAILQEGLDRGLDYITDADARPQGGAHPQAHLWDNGESAASALRDALEVRRIALAKFGAQNLPDGEPLALLQETFVPVYLYHRFQVEAAVKSVGGLDYRYNLKGDGQPLARFVDAAAQRDALAAVLECLSPERLDIDEKTLSLLVPRPWGYAGGNRELFATNTAPAFDAMGVASTAMDMVVQLLLVPERCARLADQARRDPAQLSLEESIDLLLERAFDRREDGERLRALQRGLQRVVVDRMMERAVDASSTDAVRVVLEDRLARLQRRLVRRSDAGSGLDAAHDALLSRDLDRFLYQRRHDAVEPWRPAPAPPGSPIGSGELERFLGDRCSQR